MRTTRIVVLMTDGEAERLKALAARDTRSVSSFVRCKLLPLIEAVEADDAAA